MPKKILYLVTQSDFGGAQRYVYDLAVNISDNFSVIVAGGEPGYDGDLAQRLQQKNISYVYLSHLKRAISPWHDVLAFWQIVKLIKKEHPDIIHLNSSKVSILGSLAAKIINLKSKIKIIYTVHGWVFNEELPVWKKYCYLWCERFTARFKNNIICLSEFEKNNTVKNKIAPAKKISVIYNGREEINFFSREEARKKLGIADNAFAIGSIGNLYKNKGYEYLIKSISQMLNVKCQVLIIGDGPELKNLKSLPAVLSAQLMQAGEIINLKLESIVKFVGA